MIPLCPSADEALSIAQAIVASRYADAEFAFAAGSIMRGEGTRLSDIDLVVIYERLETARRESFIADGVPIEAFVHDRATLAWFVNEDVARGQPSLLNMIVEGVAIGGAPYLAEELRQSVVKRLAEGAPEMTSAQLNALRYAITDAIDDLRGERSSSEIMAIGAMLYSLLAELSLRGRGRWNGTGKWIPRLLVAAEANLASQFDHAFRALFVSREREPVIALAEQEMRPHGGRHFDGDCRSAPPSWRIDATAIAKGC